jgi:hypothetical protein
LVVFSGTVVVVASVLIAAVDLVLNLPQVPLALVFRELDDVLFTSWALLPVDEPLAETVDVEDVVTDGDLH